MNRRLLLLLLPFLFGCEMPQVFRPLRLYDVSNGTTTQVYLQNTSERSRPQELRGKHSTANLCSTTDSHKPAGPLVGFILNRPDRHEQPFRTQTLQSCTGLERIPMPNLPEQPFLSETRGRLSRSSSIAFPAISIMVTAWPKTTRDITIVSSFPSRNNS